MSESSNGQLSGQAPTKPVKACRVCKIGKNKCEVEVEGGPCKRCEAAGVQCVRDPPKKRRNRALESTVPIRKPAEETENIDNRSLGASADNNRRNSGLPHPSNVASATLPPALSLGDAIRPVQTEDRVARLEKALEGLGSKLEQYMSVFTGQAQNAQRESSNSGNPSSASLPLFDYSTDPSLSNNRRNVTHDQYQQVSSGLPELGPPTQGAYGNQSTLLPFQDQFQYSNIPGPSFHQLSSPPMPLHQPVASTSQLPPTRQRSSSRAEAPSKRARIDAQQSTLQGRQASSPGHGNVPQFGVSSSRNEVRHQQTEDSRDSSDQEPPGWPEKAAWKPGGVHTEMYGVLPYSTPGSEASSREQSQSPIESMALPQSNLHRPFDALADAVAAVELMEQQQRLGQDNTGEKQGMPSESPIDAEGATPTGSTTTDTSERRRKKAAGVRRRGITRSTATALPSVVTQNLISLHEAWRLFDFYKRSCHQFVPVLSEVSDTFDNIQREPMLLNSILAVAATRNKDLLDSRKDKAGPNVRSLIVAEVSNNVHISLHRPASGRGVVQALITFAAWHHYPFSLAGHALRMAVELRLYLAMDKLMNPATRHPDESEEELYASARIWLATIWLDFQISTGTGRLTIYSDQIKPGFLDLYRTHRLAEATDTVLASNMELMVLKRNVFDDPTAANKVDFDSWLAKWDVHLSKYGSADSFHRQYLVYQHSYAIVETLVPKLRHGSIKSSSSPSQKAYQTDVLEPLYQAARSCITICLSKWTLYHALPYMPRHTLVQISYVSLLALQLAHATRKSLLDPNKVLDDSRAVAELIGRVHLGARFASTIRKAADRFQHLQEETSPKSATAAPPAEASNLNMSYDSRLFVPPIDSSQPQGAGQMWPFDFSLTGGINEGSGSWLASNSMDWATQFLANPPTTGATSAGSADEHIADLDALLFDFGGGSGQTTYNSNWAASLPFGSME